MSQAEQPSYEGFADTARYARGLFVGGFALRATEVELLDGQQAQVIIAGRAMRRGTGYRLAGLARYASGNIVGERHLNPDLFARAHRHAWRTDGCLGFTLSESGMLRLQGTQEDLPNIITAFVQNLGSGSGGADMQARVAGDNLRVIANLQDTGDLVFADVALRQALLNLVLPEGPAPVTPQ